MHFGCRNQKFLLWQDFKQLDVIVIPRLFFSAKLAWGNALCKACKILSRVFSNSGFEIAGSALPGEAPALCDAGTIFCMAVAKSFAVTLIDLASIFSLLSLSCICG